MLAAITFLLVIFIILVIMSYIKIGGSPLMGPIWPDIVLQSVFSTIIFYFLMLLYLKKKEKRKESESAQ